MRLLKWSAITYAAALPFANGAWFVSHFWFPCQLTRFFLGMVVGDAVLHVEMDEPTERLCGRVTDAVVGALAVLSLCVPWTEQTYPIMYLLHNFPVSFILFGLCRSRHARSARFFALPLFTGFTPFTYCAYLVHIPLFQWGAFIANEKIGSLGEVLRHDYTVCAAGPDCGAGGPMPFFYIYHFTLAIVAAVLLTVLVHHPVGKLWNRLVAGGADARAAPAFRRAAPPRSEYEQQVRRQAPPPPPPTCPPSGVRLFSQRAVFLSSLSRLS